MISLKQSNKTILVTGASGFIGKFFIKYIQENTNWKIKAISRSKSLEVSKNLDFIVIKDILKFNDWDKILSNVHIVVHLLGAAHLNSPKTECEKKYYYDVNSELTKNIIVASVKKKIEKFIFISSIKVNGEYTFDERPFSINDVPKPLDIYGESKLLAEENIIKHCCDSNVKYTIIRPPLVYGPNPKGNFKRLVNLVKNGYPLPFKGFNKKRSFISIYNLVDFIVFSIRNKSVNNKIILISDQYDVSISKLINIMSTLNTNGNNRKVNLFYFPSILFKLFFKILGKNDLSHKLLMPLQINSKETKKNYSWRPKFSIKQGLKKAFHEEII